MTSTDQHSLPDSDLIPALYAARRQARMLPKSHPAVKEAVGKLLEKIEAGLHGASSVTVSILGTELYLDGHLLARESLSYATLVRELTERKLDSMVFERGISLDELARFVALTNRRADEIEVRGGWKTVLAKENIARVGVHQVAGLERATTAGASHAKVAVDTYKHSLESILASFHEARQGSSIDLGTIQHSVKMFLMVMMDDPEVFRSLSTIKRKDQYTFYHSINVSVLSLLLAFKLRLDPALLEMVGMAAILHDIGKMRVPLEILNKPGGFTDPEWAIMQSHAVEGARLLLTAPEMRGVPMIVAAQHHAGHTREGYPNLSGMGRLHLVSELVSIADVFDALTSDRPYRPAMLPDQAMKIITGGSGKAFHPALVKVFAQMSGMFPIGTLVELDTEELAVVVRANPDDLFRPRVRILRGQPGAHAVKAEIDLGEKNEDGDYVCGIVRSVDPQKYHTRASTLVLGPTAA